MCLAPLVVFPQCNRLIDVFLLALLAATTEQDNDLQTVFGQIDTVARPPVDLVLANAAELLHMGQIALLHPGSGDTDLGSSHRIKGGKPLSVRTAAIGQKQLFDLITHWENSNTYVSIHANQIVRNDIPTASSRNARGTVDNKLIAARARSYWLGD